jgi:hypothetical protein
VHQILTGFGEVDDDLAPVHAVMLHLHQFALLEPVHHAAYGGLIDHRGLDDVGQRAAFVVTHGAQHHELRSRKLRVGNVLLEKRGMPLIDASQQVADLVRKVIAILWRHG